MVIQQFGSDPWPGTLCCVLRHKNTGGGEWEGGGGGGNNSYMYTVAASCRNKNKL